MKNKSCGTIAALLCSVTFLFLIGEISAGPLSNIQLSQCNTVCDKRAKHPMPKGAEFQYRYSANSVSRLYFVSPDETGFHFASLVTIRVLSECDFLLKVSEVEVQEKNASTNGYSRSIDSPIYEKALNGHSVHVNSKDGKIMKICKENDQPEWITNILKGIASSLNIYRLSGDMSTETITTNDIMGHCEASLSKGNAEGVILQKNLESCTNRMILNNLYFGSTYETSPSKSYQTPIITDNTHSCVMSLTSDNLMVGKSHCKETYFVKPFSHLSSGLVTEITQNIEIVSQTTVSKKIGHISKTFIKTPLRFIEGRDFDEEKTNKVTLVDIKAKLSTLCSSPMNKNVKATTPADFSDLISLLRKVSKTDMGQILNLIESSNFCLDTFALRKLFIDALVLCNTQDSILFLGEKTMLLGPKDIIPDTWLYYFSISKMEPTEAILSLMRKMLDVNPVNKQVIFAASTAVKKYCGSRSRDTCVNKNANVSDILNKIKTLLIDEENDKDIRLTILKAIGNLRYDYNDLFGDAIMNIVTSKKYSMFEKSIALTVLRDVSYKGNKISTIESILEDSTVDTELRIKAYLVLIENPTYSLISKVKRNLFKEKSNQLNSFIWTHLSNLRETDDPTLKQLRDIIQTTDPQLLEAFQMEKLKYSRNYEKTFFSERWNIGGKAEADVMFSEKSFAPRYASLNLTTFLFGRSYNLMRADGRLEGLEKAADIFLKKENSRLSTQSKIGAILRQVEGCIGLEMFDSQVDFFTFKNIDLPEFSLDVVSFLRNGLQKNFDKTMQILDTKVRFATSIGFPLLFHVDAVSAVKIEAFVQFQRDHRQLSFATLKTNVAPSAAITLNALSAIESPVGNYGFKLRSTMHTNTEIDFNFLISSKKEIKLEVNAPQERQEFINFSSEVLIVRKSRSQKMQLADKNSQVSYSFCSSNLMSQLLGLNLCTNIEHLKLTMEKSILTSMFLTPMKFSIFLEKTDNQKKYTFNLIHADTPSGSHYKLEFDTPNSGVDRNILMEMQYNRYDNLKVFAKNPWMDSSLIIRKNKLGTLDGYIIWNKKKIFSVEGKRFELMPMRTAYIEYDVESSVLFGDQKVNLHINNSETFRDQKTSLVINNLYDSPIAIKYRNYFRNSISLTYNTGNIVGELFVTSNSRERQLRFSHENKRDSSHLKIEHSLNNFRYDNQIVLKNLLSYKRLEKEYINIELNGKYINSIRRQVQGKAVVNVDIPFFSKQTFSTEHKIGENEFGEIELMSNLNYNGYSTLSYDLECVVQDKFKGHAKLTVNNNEILQGRYEIDVVNSNKFKISVKGHYKQKMIILYSLLTRDRHSLGLLINAKLASHSITLNVNHMKESQRTQNLKASIESSLFTKAELHLNFDIVSKLRGKLNGFLHIKNVSEPYKIQIEYALAPLNRYFFEKSMAMIIFTRNEVVHNVLVEGAFNREHALIHVNGEFYKKVWNYHIEGKRNRINNTIELALRYQTPHTVKGLEIKSHFMGLHRLGASLNVTVNKNESYTTSTLLNVNNNFLEKKFEAAFEITTPLKRHRKLSLSVNALGQLLYQNIRLNAEWGQAKRLLFDLSILPKSRSDISSSLKVSTPFTMLSSFSAEGKYLNRDNNFITEILVQKGPQVKDKFLILLKAQDKEMDKNGYGLKNVNLKVHIPNKAVINFNLQNKNKIGHCVSQFEMDFNNIDVFNGTAELEMTPQRFVINSKINTSFKNLRTGQFNFVKRNYLYSTTVMTNIYLNQDKIFDSLFQRTKEYFETFYIAKFNVKCPVFTTNFDLELSGLRKRLQLLLTGAQHKFFETDIGLVQTEKYSKFTLIIETPPLSLSKVTYNSTTQHFRTFSDISSSLYFTKDKTNYRMFDGQLKRNSRSDNVITIESDFFGKTKTIYSNNLRKLIIIYKEEDILKFEYTRQFNAPNIIKFWILNFVDNELKWDNRSISNNITLQVANYKGSMFVSINPRHSFKMNLGLDNNGKNYFVSLLEFEQTPDKLVIFFDLNTALQSTSKVRFGFSMKPQMEFMSITLFYNAFKTKFLLNNMPSNYQILGHLTISENIYELDLHYQPMTRRLKAIVTVGHFKSGFDLSFVNDVKDKKVEIRLLLPFNFLNVVHFKLAGSSKYYHSFTFHQKLLLNLNRYETNVEHLFVLENSKVMLIKALLKSHLLNYKFTYNTNGKMYNSYLTVFDENIFNVKAESSRNDVKFEAVTKFDVMKKLNIEWHKNKPMTVLCNIKTSLNRTVLGRLTLSPDDYFFRGFFEIREFEAKRFESSFNLQMSPHGMSTNLAIHHNAANVLSFGLDVIQKNTRSIGNGYIKSPFTNATVATLSDSSQFTMKMLFSAEQNAESMVKVDFNENTGSREILVGKNIISTFLPTLKIEGNALFKQEKLGNGDYDIKIDIPVLLKKPFVLQISNRDKTRKLTFTLHTDAFCVSSSNYWSSINNFEFNINNCNTLSRFIHLVNKNDVFEFAYKPGFVLQSEPIILTLTNSPLNKSIIIDSNPLKFAFHGEVTEKRDVNVFLKMDSKRLSFEPIMVHFTKKAQHLTLKTNADIPYLRSLNVDIDCIPGFSSCKAKINSPYFGYTTSTFSCNSRYGTRCNSKFRSTTLKKNINLVFGGHKGNFHLQLTLNKAIITKLLYRQNAKMELTAFGNTVTFSNNPARGIFMIAKFKGVVELKVELDKRRSTWKLHYSRPMSSEISVIYNHMRSLVFIDNKQTIFHFSRDRHLIFFLKNFITIEVFLHEVKNVLKKPDSLYTLRYEYRFNHPIGQNKLELKLKSFRMSSFLDYNYVTQKLTYDLNLPLFDITTGLKMAIDYDIGYHRIFVSGNCNKLGDFKFEHLPSQASYLLEGSLLDVKWHGYVKNRNPFRLELALTHNFLFDFGANIDLKSHSYTFNVSIPTFGINQKAGFKLSFGTKTFQNSLVTQRSWKQFIKSIKTIKGTYNNYSFELLLNKVHIFASDVVLTLANEKQLTANFKHDLSLKYVSLSFDKSSIEREMAKSDSQNLLFGKFEYTRGSGQLGAKINVLANDNKLFSAEFEYENANNIVFIRANGAMGEMNIFSLRGNFRRFFNSHSASALVTVLQNTYDGKASIDYERELTLNVQFSKNTEKYKFLLSFDGTKHLIATLETPLPNCNFEVQGFIINSQNEYNINGFIKHKLWGKTRFTVKFVKSLEESFVFFLFKDEGEFDNDDDDEDANDEKEDKYVITGSIRLKNEGLLNVNGHFVVKLGDFQKDITLMTSLNKMQNSVSFIWLTKGIIESDQKVILEVSNIDKFHIKAGAYLTHNHHYVLQFNYSDTAIDAIVGNKFKKIQFFAMKRGSYFKHSLILVSDEMKHGYSIIVDNFSIQHFELFTPRAQFYKIKFSQISVQNDIPEYFFIIGHEQNPMFKINRDFKELSLSLGFPKLSTFKEFPAILKPVSFAMDFKFELLVSINSNSKVTVIKTNMPGFKEIKIEHSPKSSTKMAKKGDLRLTIAEQGIDSIFTYDYKRSQDGATFKLDGKVAGQKYSLKIDTKTGAHNSFYMVLSSKIHHNEITHFKVSFYRKITSNSRLTKLSWECQYLPTARQFSFVFDYKKEKNMHNLLNLVKCDYMTIMEVILKAEPLKYKGQLSVKLLEDIEVDISVNVLKKSEIFLGKYYRKSGNVRHSLKVTQGEGFDFTVTLTYPKDTTINFKMIDNDNFKITINKIHFIKIFYRKRYRKVDLKIETSSEDFKVFSVAYNAVKRKFVTVTGRFESKPLYIDGNYRRDKGKKITLKLDLQDGNKKNIGVITYDINFREEKSKFHFQIYDYSFTMTRNGNFMKHDFKIDIKSKDGYTKIEHSHVYRRKFFLTVESKYGSDYESNLKIDYEQNQQFIFKFQSELFNAKKYFIFELTNNLEDLKIESTATILKAFLKWLSSNSLSDTVKDLKWYKIVKNSEEFSVKTNSKKIYEIDMKFDEDKVKLQVGPYFVHMSLTQNTNKKRSYNINSNYPYIKAAFLSVEYVNNEETVLFLTSDKYRATLKVKKERKRLHFNFNSNIDIIKSVSLEMVKKQTTKGEKMYVIYQRNKGEGFLYVTATQKMKANDVYLEFSYETSLKQIKPLRMTYKLKNNEYQDMFIYYDNKLYFKLTDKMTFRPGFYQSYRSVEYFDKGVAISREKVNTTYVKENNKHYFRYHLIQIVPLSTPYRQLITNVEGSYDTGTGDLVGELYFGISSQKFKRFQVSSIASYTKFGYMDESHGKYHFGCDSKSHEYDLQLPLLKLSRRASDSEDHHHLEHVINYDMSYKVENVISLSWKQKEIAITTDIPGYEKITVSFKPEKAKVQGWKGEYEGKFKIKIPAKKIEYEIKYEIEWKMYQMFSMELKESKGKWKFEFDIKGGDGFTLESNMDIKKTEVFYLKYKRQYSPKEQSSELEYKFLYATYLKSLKFFAKLEKKYPSFKSELKLSVNDMKIVEGKVQYSSVLSKNTAALKIMDDIKLVALLHINNPQKNILVLKYEQKSKGIKHILLVKQIDGINFNVTLTYPRKMTLQLMMINNEKFQIKINNRDQINIVYKARYKYKLLQVTTTLAFLKSMKVELDQKSRVKKTAHFSFKNFRSDIKFNWLRQPQKKIEVTTSYNFYGKELYNLKYELLLKKAKSTITGQINGGQLVAKREGTFAAHKCSLTYTLKGKNKPMVKVNHKFNAKQRFVDTSIMVDYQNRKALVTLKNAPKEGIYKYDSSYEVNGKIKQFFRISYSSKKQQFVLESSNVYFSSLTVTQLMDGNVESIFNGKNWMKLKSTKNMIRITTSNPNFKHLCIMFDREEFSYFKVLFNEYYWNITRNAETNKRLYTIKANYPKTFNGKVIYNKMSNKKHTFEVKTDDYKANLNVVILENAIETRFSSNIAVISVVKLDLKRIFTSGKYEYVLNYDRNDGTGFLDLYLLVNMYSKCVFRYSSSLKVIKPINVELIQNKQPGMQKIEFFIKYDNKLVYKAMILNEFTDKKMVMERLSEIYSNGKIIYRTSSNYSMKRIGSEYQFIYNLESIRLESVPFKHMILDVKGKLNFVKMEGAVDLYIGIANKKIIRTKVLKTTNSLQVDVDNSKYIGIFYNNDKERKETVLSLNMPLSSFKEPIRLYLTLGKYRYMSLQIETPFDSLRKLRFSNLENGGVSLAVNDFTILEVQKKGHGHIGLLFLPYDSQVAWNTFDEVVNLSVAKAVFVNLNLKTIQFYVNVTQEYNSIKIFWASKKHFSIYYNIRTKRFSHEWGIKYYSFKKNLTLLLTTPRREFGVILKYGIVKIQLSKEDIFTVYRVVDENIVLHFRFSKIPEPVILRINKNVLSGTIEYTKNRNDDIIFSVTPDKHNSTIKIIQKSSNTVLMLKYFKMSQHIKMSIKLDSNYIKDNNHNKYELSMFNNTVLLRINDMSMEHTQVHLDNGIFYNCTLKNVTSNLILLSYGLRTTSTWDHNGVFFEQKLIDYVNGWDRVNFLLSYRKTSPKLTEVRVYLESFQSLFRSKELYQIRAFMRQKLRITLLKDLVMVLKNVANASTALHKEMTKSIGLFRKDILEMPQYVMDLYENNVFFSKTIVKKLAFLGRICEKAKILFQNVKNQVIQIRNVCRSLCDSVRMFFNQKIHRLSKFIFKSTMRISRQAVRALVRLNIVQSRKLLKPLLNAYKSGIIRFTTTLNKTSMTLSDTKIEKELKKGLIQLTQLIERHSVAVAQLTLKRFKSQNISRNSVIKKMTGALKWLIHSFTLDKTVEKVAFESIAMTSGYLKRILQRRILQSLHLDKFIFERDTSAGEGVINFRAQFVDLFTVKYPKLTLSNIQDVFPIVDYVKIVKKYGMSLPTAPSLGRFTETAISQQNTKVSFDGKISRLDFRSRILSQYKKEWKITRNRFGAIGVTFGNQKIILHRNAYIHVNIKNYLSYNNGDLTIFRIGHNIVLKHKFYKVHIVYNYVKRYLIMKASRLYHGQLTGSFGNMNGEQYDEEVSTRLPHKSRFISSAMEDKVCSYLYSSPFSPIAQCFDFLNPAPFYKLCKRGINHFKEYQGFCNVVKTVPNFVPTRRADGSSKYDKLAIWYPKK